jgi:hypothetical protein
MTDSTTSLQDQTFDHQALGHADQPALPAEDEPSEILYQGVWYSRKDFERHRRLGLVEGLPEAYG